MDYELIMLQDRVRTLESKIKSLEDTNIALKSSSEISSERLDRNIEYSEYLAERFTEFLSYVDYMSKYKVYINYDEYMKIIHLSDEEKIKLIRESRIDSII